MTALAPALQAYFTDRLIGQRAASPNTIAAYKVTFRLLLGFASQRTGRKPSALDIADLDAPLIAAFLDHLVGIPHLTGHLSPDFALGEGSPSDGRDTPALVAGVQA